MNLFYRIAMSIFLLAIVARDAQCSFNVTPPPVVATALVFMNHANKLTCISGPLSEKLKSVIKDDIASRYDDDEIPKNILVKPLFEDPLQMLNNCTNSYKVITHLKSMYPTVYVADVDEVTSKALWNNMAAKIKYQGLNIEDEKEQLLKKSMGNKKQKKLNLFKPQLIYAIENVKLDSNSI